MPGATRSFCSIGRVMSRIRPSSSTTACSVIFDSTVTSADEMMIPASSSITASSTIHTPGVVTRM